MGLDKKYVSDIDKFLAEFDRQHPEKSASQLRTIAKNARIAKLRDDAKATEPKPELWEEF